MDHRSVFDTSVVRLHGTASSDADDVLAVEEPLEIQVQREGEKDWLSLSVTMRTPGNDDELAAGFLLGESIIRRRTDIVSAESWGPLTGELRVRNIMRVTLADATQFDACQLRRNFYTTSSCGVCGKASLEAIDAMRPPPLDNREIRIDAEALYQWPARLRERQEVFGSTGGLHAAALFTSAGECLIVREDVGRHNATDKPPASLC